jgi:hypothetical protein
MRCKEESSSYFGERLGVTLAAGGPMHQRWRGAGPGVSEQAKGERVLWLGMGRTKANSTRAARKRRSKRGKRVGHHGH